VHLHVSFSSLPHFLVPPAASYTVRYANVIFWKCCVCFLQSEHFPTCLVIRALKWTIYP